MKTAIAWIVLMDGFNLKVFQVEGLNGQRELVHADQSEFRSIPERDLISDAPGRVHDSHGHGRHSMEPATHAREHQKDKFIESSLGWLEAASRRNEFDRLVLVAPPKVLGKIRAALPDSIKCKVSDEIGKDLLNVPTDRLYQAIATMKLT